jgi:two-component system nitrogen regulation sensor histidine kinase NtrY
MAVSPPTPAIADRAPIQPASGHASGSAGFIIVVLALASALATFLLLAGMTPIEPTSTVVRAVLLANFALLLGLCAVVVFEVMTLMRARRAGLAGARLHGRMVRWFAFIAAMPAILVAIVASFTLSRGLDDWLNQPIRTLVTQSAIIADRYRDAQCNMLGREARLLAADLDRAKAMFAADRELFKQYLANRASLLGIPRAELFDGKMQPVEVAIVRDVGEIRKPNEEDIRAVRESGEGVCLVTALPDVISALVPTEGFDNGLLYATRRIDPDALEFPRRARTGIAVYEALERVKPTVIGAFATMYGLISLIALFSAVWLGLRFANSLVAPVRRLILATDQVAVGNYYVQVPIHPGEGDLAHLGATFNKMTGELRRQHDRLVQAADQIDRRRRFTEAVLSGVPAGVIGLDAGGRVTVINPSAERILNVKSADIIGLTLAEVAGEVADAVQSVLTGRLRSARQQITLRRAGQERQIDIAATTDEVNDSERSIVVSLDDISDLVVAQRSSAWADVARRIAHEIKNPLTPIQLSIERIKRKYGRTLTEDRTVFDQCTDTIVRQVDDIRRMVDEFSSFARMPKPTLESADLADVVRQTIFLQRVGNPDIEIVDDLPNQPVIARFDRRLISQALINLVKNAAESVAAVPEAERGPGRISVRLAEIADLGLARIDIIDNGKGFPVENRRRLLEPYMTTRDGGTGLGLAIVAKILEDHEGSIDLADNPGGRGAMVCITLPLAQPAGATPPRPAAQKTDEQIA